MIFSISVREPTIPAIVSSFTHLSFTPLFVYHSRTARPHSRTNRYCALLSSTGRIVSIAPVFGTSVIKSDIRNGDVCVYLTPCALQSGNLPRVPYARGALFSWKTFNSHRAKALIKIATISRSRLISHSTPIKVSSKARAASSLKAQLIITRFENV